MITEKAVREIYAAKDLSKYKMARLREADAWIKGYALGKLQLRLRQTPSEIREYVMLMVRCHFGAAETDEFLTKLKCYPEWLEKK